MHIQTLLPALALVASASAQGFVHYDVEKRAVSGSGNQLRRRATSAINAQLAQNLANLNEYIINVTIGTPGQRVGVTLDTGSSDLWVPSASFCRTNQCDFGSFNPLSSSSYQTIEANGFNITYAAAGDSDAGDWAADTVSVGGASGIQNQIFGLSNAGYDVHGVMGIGYDTHETYGPNGQNYPSVVDNMLTVGLINRRAYSLYLNSYNQTFGSLAFGGIDTTKYTGNLVALPIQNGPGGEGKTEFFVTLSQVTFTDAAGVASVLTPQGYAQSVLLDSGTSYTALTNDPLERLTKGMGAVTADKEGDLVLSCGYNTTNATLTYTFGGSNGVSITVPVADTIGQSLGAPNPNVCSFGFGEALDGISVLGDTFLRNAYVVYDLDNSVIAMAQAVSGQQGTSSIQVIPSGTSLPGVSSTASASGTQLSGAAATRRPKIASASGHHSTLKPASPTFNLAAAATGGSGSSRSSNAATVPTATGLPQIALVGAGLIAGAFAL